MPSLLLQVHSGEEGRSTGDVYGKSLQNDRFATMFAGQVVAQSTFGTIVGTAVDASGAAIPAVGGWQLSTVTLWQTGPFLTPTISPSLEQADLDIVNRGSLLRPDRIGNGNISNPTPDRWFDINAFAPTPLRTGRIGNAGVGILVGPSTLAVSAGLSKRFTLTEHVSARLEATFTNLPNHSNYAAPAVDVTRSSTFGKVNSVQTAEGSGDRTGQVSLRIEF